MSAVVFQFQANGQRDVENAFKGITSAAEKSSKSVIKETDQQAKALGKLAKEVDKTSKQIEKIRVQASKKATDQILADYERQAKAAEKLAERINGSLGKINRGGSGGGFGKLGSLAGMAAGAALAAATAAVVQVTREAIKLDELATRVSINGRLPGQGFANKNAIRGAAVNAAIANPGVSSEDVLQGTLAFQGKTGRLDIAQQMQGTWATLASASGAKLEDIAKASADLFEKFDIKTVKEMKEALTALYIQGKEGSFELKDAADQYARLAGAASRFNFGKGVEAVRTLGAFTQIAKRTTGSPEEASTAVERMLSGAIEHENKLRAAGVKVFDKNGQTFNPMDIVAESIAKLGGYKPGAAKQKALLDVYGERGIRAISPLMQIYEDTFLAQKKLGKSDTDAGKAAFLAITDEMDRVKNATKDFGEVQKDAAEAQKLASAQLTASWEQIKASAAENLVPALSSLAKVIADMLPRSAVQQSKSAMDQEYEMKDKPLKDRAAEILSKGVPTAEDVKELETITGQREGLREQYFPTASREPLSKAELAQKLKEIGMKDYAEGKGLSSWWAQKGQKIYGVKEYNDLKADATAEKFSKNHNLDDVSNFEGTLTEGQKMLLQREAQKAQKLQEEQNAADRAQKLADATGNATRSIDELAESIANLNKNLPLSATGSK